jgi:hypothetical protein
MSFDPPSIRHEADAAAERRRRLPVFAAGRRTWTVGDVLAIAPRVLAEPQRVSSTKAPAIDDATIDTAVKAFRYEHRLVSAEECLAWLATRELSFADLRASVRRRLAGIEAPTTATAEIDCLLAAEFAQAAHALAARVAAALEAEALPEGAAAECWPELDACYQAFVSATFTTTARERTLAMDRLNWLRVECAVIEFDQLDAAREARHCVDDGQSLSEIAAMGHFAFRSGRWLVSALPKAWSQALFQIRPGMVTQPIADGERLLLLGFQRLIEPSLSDPDIAAGIDAAILQPALQALLARQVQWVLPGLKFF